MITTPTKKNAPWHQGARQLPGVSRRDFGVPPEPFISDLHGPAHVNRVIVLGQLLIKRVFPNNETGARALWAACFLHDLARTHDDVCTLHGFDAVELKWERYKGLFRQHGVDAIWDENIKAAVINHCQDRDVPHESPDYKLAALLKDADALDRVRLAGLHAIDTSRLRFDETHQLIDFAFNLYCYTEENGTEAIGPMWTFAEEHLR